MTHLLIIKAKLKVIDSNLHQECKWILLNTIHREDNVDYSELHHYDQVTLLLEEVKQRVTYGSGIPNLCRCRRRPMVLLDHHNAELNFESLASLNVLYELWKDSASAYCLVCSLN